MAFWSWSRTAASNATADNTINWAEGQSPSSINDSARAMMARLADWRQDVSGTITTGGTSTAYTVTSNQTFDTLAHLDGAMIGFIPHVTNGTAPTLNVDGLGAKGLRFGPTTRASEIQSGVLIQGTPYVATYVNADSSFYIQNSFNNTYGVPVGGIVPYLASTPPSSSFALLYGQAISQATYVVLYATIGPNAFGTDSGGNFSLPDLRGRAIFGLDNMGGSTAGRITAAGGSFDGTVIGGSGGAQTHTLTQAELPAFKPGITITDPSHSHLLTNGLSPISTNAGAIYISGGSSGGGVSQTTIQANTTGITAAFTSNLGSGNGHTIVPPAMTLPFIVRVI
jgi:microcystin-dependent protein